MLNHLITSNPNCRVIGPTNENVRNAVIKIDNNGVNKLSNTVGITLRNPFQLRLRYKLLQA